MITEPTPQSYRFSTNRREVPVASSDSPSGLDTRQLVAAGSDQILSGDENVNHDIVSAVERGASSVWPPASSPLPLGRRAGTC